MFFLPSLVLFALPLLDIDHSSRKWNSRDGEGKFFQSNQIFGSKLKRRGFL